MDNKLAEKLEEMRACENGMCCHCIDLLLEAQELLGAPPEKEESFLPWPERVTMLSINPDAATRHDIARMAAELSEEKK